jgi:hypothetical protein
LVSAQDQKEGKLEGTGVRGLKLKV